MEILFYKCKKERAGLLNLLASDFDALDNLSSPEKIYCENTNLMYALTAEATNDGVEVGFGNKIPLWLFGFLY